MTVNAGWLLSRRAVGQSDPVLDDQSACRASPCCGSLRRLLRHAVRSSSLRPYGFLYVQAKPWTLTLSRCVLQLKPLVPYLFDNLPGLPRCLKSAISSSISFYIVNFNRLLHSQSSDVYVIIRSSKLDLRIFS